MHPFHFLQKSAIVANFAEHVLFTDENISVVKVFPTHIIHMLGLLTTPSVREIEMQNITLSTMGGTGIISDSLVGPHLLPPNLDVEKYLPFSRLCYRVF